MLVFIIILLLKYSFIPCHVLSIMVFKCTLMKEQINFSKSKSNHYNWVYLSLVYFLREKQHFLWRFLALPFLFCFTWLLYLTTNFLWEKVTTTKITTSKTIKNIKKFVNHHYIESVFLVHHYIKNHCLFSSSLLQKSEHRKEWKEHWKSQFCLIFTFWLPMAKVPMAFWRKKKF